MKRKNKKKYCIVLLGRVFQHSLCFVKKKDRDRIRRWLHKSDVSYSTYIKK